MGCLVSAYSYAKLYIYIYIYISPLNQAVVYLFVCVRVSRIILSSERVYRLHVHVHVYSIGLYYVVYNIHVT